MRLEQFAVIGHPIGHTMSPFIHKRLFALSGLAPEYKVLDIADLRECREALGALDGFNITIPHKMAIIPLLDEIDDQARRFGSVNTVKAEGGRMKGYTTDGLGCMKALALHGAAEAEKILMLGSGGAARAVAFALAEKNKGLSLTLAARSPSKAQGLLEDVGAGGRVLSLEDLEEDREKYDLLINATSVGMYPHGGISPVSAAVVGRCSGVFDAVYNPNETELLRLGGALGKNLIYGMEMLVMQAAAAQEIWYGAAFGEEALLKLCADAAEEMEKVFAIKKEDGK